MAGRLFEQFPLDINIVPGDRRPVEAVRIARNPLSFAGIETLTVPMLPIPQQLAEKLHACVREYADGTSSRAKDAFDTVVIASILDVPDADTLRETVRATFALRETEMPQAAPGLPPKWHTELNGYLEEYPITVAARPRDHIDIERLLHAANHVGAVLPAPSSNKDVLLAAKYLRGPYSRDADEQLRLVIEQVVPRPDDGDAFRNL